MFGKFKKKTITVKAYTPFQELVRNNCLRVGHSINRSEVPKQKQKETHLCFGYVKGLNNSITMFSPCDFIVDYTVEGSMSYTFPDGMDDNISTMLHSGMEHFGENNVCLTKINFPFGFACEGAHDWVVCSHMFNFSGMIIPSGVNDFMVNPMMDVFNLVPFGSKYFVKAGTPLVSIYLRDQKRVELDFQYNPQEYDNLERQRCYFHLKADSLKRQKLRDT